MVGTWIYLDNENQVLMIPILNAETLLKIFNTQGYSLKHILGIAYDLWSHDCIQQAQNLVVELLNHYNPSSLSEALAELKSELSVEDESVTTDFYGLLERHNVVSP